MIRAVINHGVNVIDWNSIVLIITKKIILLIRVNY